MDDILVTASEYSILIALKNGAKSTKELSQRLGYTEDKCLSRIYYFLTSGFIQRNDTSGFEILIDIERCAVYPNEQVKQFRMHSNRKFKLHDTSHIKPNQIEQIRHLVKLGYRRSEIVSKVGIKKSDLLMVLHEHNITSINKPLSDDKAIFDRAERLIQYKQTYLKAKELREAGFTNKDIAEYLNRKNYKNRVNGGFTPISVYELLKRTPKILLEDENERSNQEIAQ